MTASLTIFVCSTFSDLSQEREGVLDAIRRLKLQHDSMEFFGARAEQPIETCLQEVRASDLLVVIVGHRYGSIVPELGISYSEAEYSEGFRLKKPCLVYMRDDNFPILPKHMERDPKKLKPLERWKETLQSRHTVAAFQDGNRLAVQVAADLARTIRDLEEVAKARATARTEGGTALFTEVTTVITDALGQGVPEASLLSAIRSSVSALLGTMQKREPIPQAQAGRSAYYTPSWMWLVVRTSGDPAAIAPSVRGVIRRVEPLAAIARVQTMEQVVSASVAARRFATALIAGFAVVALLLAGIGIYGVIAYSVTQRHFEIGLRLALGATPTAVARQVLGEGLRTAMIGAVLGLAVALGTTRLLRAMFVDVSVTDPVTLASVTVLLVLAAMAASWLPARRASAVDPLSAMK